jgi:ribosomal protein S18 acetylase RimI-like enzyme
MTDVERLLISSEVDLRPGDPQAEDAGACFDAYVAELVGRTDGDFKPAHAPSLVSGPALVPPAGVLLVARFRDEPVGTGALTFDGDNIATLHRMWVSPTFRGRGLGRRLLAELESYAIARGATTLRLETKRVLAEAVALYRSSGFRDTAPFSDDPNADCWLEKPVGPLTPRAGATNAG